MPKISEIEMQSGYQILETHVFPRVSYATLETQTEADYLSRKQCENEKQKTESVLKKVLSEHSKVRSQAMQSNKS